jgi:FkbM family methyltransferase
MQIKTVKLATHPNGAKVIEGDTHVSKWVIESNRLDHDQSLLPALYRYVRPRDIVIDAGANIGDHTHAYLSWGAQVLAFEPNPMAADCLAHNCPEADVYDMALSDVGGTARLLFGDNVGAGWLDENGTVPVELVLLDTICRRADFIKIDVEGHECRVLKGAQQLIKRWNPYMCIEVNRGALERAGSSVDQLMEMLNHFQYDTIPLATGVQYDMICIPRKFAR